MDFSQAAVSFLEAIEEELDRGKKVPAEFLGDFAMWAEASGMKNGSKARYSCWPASAWVSTSTPLAIASLKILSGEIGARGVLGPESCLDPLPFFGEVAAHVLKKNRDNVGKLLEEQWESS